MQYDFDEVISRRNTNSIKWDCAEAVGNLPLWVADMDFRVAKPVLDALHRRVEHGIFGYAHIPDAYYEAVIRWFERRHHWTIRREHILTTAGIIPALSAILQTMADQGEKVGLHTPAYNCFFLSTRNASRTLQEIPMVSRSGRYEIDWQVMEERVQGCKMLIFCNPHNPTGRVWSKEELRQVDEICNRHGVFVMCDEIHCELTFPGVEYTPYATVATSDNWCVCTSCTKSFNLAGLPIANIVVPNDHIRARLAAAFENNRVGDLTALSIEALIAAYNESEDWLEQLQQYIYANYRYMCDYMQTYIPVLRPVRMEGTYLCWVDIRGTGMMAQTLCRQLIEKQHLMFNPGEMYGDSHYVRINMACPRSTLQEAMTRLQTFYNDHISTLKTS